ncbi:MAG: hypothetical protein AAF558_02620 [Verrucomicrobiota bacterium]
MSCIRVSKALRQKRGIALIAALAIIALTTFLVVAYLSMTRFDLLVSQSYSKTVSADQLALGFVDVLVREVLNEIEAGSDVDGASTPDPVYFPKDDAGNKRGMLPAKMVTNIEETKFPALLRRSSGSIQFDNLKPGYYDTYHDFTPSNSPILGSDISTETSTNRARGISKERWNKPKLMDEGNAIVNNLTDFVPPEWVYWTEQGVETPTPTSSDVVGRVAYVMYDISGLLDANVAGFPSTASGEEQGAKGSLAYTDLTKLGSGMTQSRADILGQWKYQGTNATTFTQLVSEWAQTGYLRPPSTGGTGKSFVGRQDFLEYAESIGIPDDLMLFFTTFSRELNEASWAGLSTTVNPNLLSLRKPDGSLYRIQRFPLSRLDLFNDPSSNLSEIEEYFGLDENTSDSDPWDYIWEYDQGTAGEIESLSNLAATQNRDPDFFELLRAGIYENSLGQTTRDRTHIENRYQDGSRFKQVAQIGANIIDLSDTNNYPVEIIFPYNDSTGTEDIRITATEYKDRIYGAEDLPYISEIAVGVLRLDNGSSTTQQRAYFPVEIWNPHQTGGPNVPSPSQFRVRAHDGIINIRNFQTPSSQPWKQFGTPYSYSSGGVSITFNNSSAFRDPTVLRTANSSSTVSNSTVDGYVTIPGPLIPTTTTDNSLTNNQSGRQNLGLYYGMSSPPNLDPPPTISLEYRQGASWRTYLTLPALVPRRSNSETALSSSRTFNWLKGMTAIDPAVTRFGYHEGQTPNAVFDRSRRPGGANPEQVSTFGLPATSTSSPGPEGLFNFSTNNPFGQLQFWGLNVLTAFYADNRGNGGRSRPIYVDRDGINRPGDAYFNEGVNPMETGNNLARPVILNRSLLSVGELGYARRDQPWKTLDLFSNVSADAGLLDLFCTYEESRVVAGRVNPNSAPKAVLQAILSGARDDAFVTNELTDGEISDIADQIIDQRTNNSLLENKASLVEVMNNLGNNLSWINSHREAPIRALADVSQTRTWNLMFDIIAQSGRIPGTAGLDEFVLEGERRYWVHIAIDRYTGEILDRQIELVYE